MVAANQQRIAVPQVEAARMLGITDRTLRYWERDGLITGTSVRGGVKLYPVADLERLAGLKGKHGDAHKL